jgi:16S rRNA (guanine527-N7)-methyltransferase
MDLGSGGGFPALPLAIVLRGSSATFLLIEPNQRKASFLRTVARELALAVEVRTSRAEEIDPRETLPPNVITSRALASLPELTRMIAPFFGAETRALLHKGREYVEEVAETRSLWYFDMLILASDTSADGAILEMRNLRSRTRS